MKSCPDCLTHCRGLQPLYKCVDEFNGLMLYCTLCSYRAYFARIPGTNKNNLPTKEQLRLNLAA